MGLSYNKIKSKTTWLFITFCPKFESFVLIHPSLFLWAIFSKTNMGDEKATRIAQIDNRAMNMNEMDIRLAFSNETAQMFNSDGALVI